MNEASVWRLALVQQIAPHYQANPKVSAVVVGGSVARGDADRFSDIDLGVFWTERPTEQERRDVVKRARGKDWRLFPSHGEGERWLEAFERGGVTIDVWHATNATTERILTDVMERADSSLPKQQHIAALLSAFPLSNPSVFTEWQQQAAAYPHELSVAMIRAHLTFRPRWEQEVLAERNDLLTLYESLCTVEQQILLVLMGLNRIYYPSFRWIDRLIGQMHLAPPNLSARFKQLFGIVSIDPLAAVYQLHELIEETFSLVETSLAEFDTMQARERFAQRRKGWEQAPDGLV